MSDKDESSIETFGWAFVTIIGDILSGFSDAAKKIKWKINTFKPDRGIVILLSVNVNRKPYIGST